MFLLENKNQNMCQLLYVLSPHNPDPLLSLSTLSRIDILIRAQLVSIPVFLKILKNNLCNFPTQRGLFERNLCGVSPAAAREVEKIILSRLLSQQGYFALLLSAKVIRVKVVDYEFQLCQECNKILPRL